MENSLKQFQNPAKIKYEYKNKNRDTVYLYQMSINSNK